MYDPRLETLISVAEKRSFSKAAQELHISQPAVSLHIQHLEETFKTKLFYRNEKDVELTAAGQILVKYASDIIGLSRRAEREMAEFLDSVGGRLAIGATLTIGEYIIPSVIGDFKAAHPDLELSLVVANTDQIASRLLERVIDMGLIEGPITHPRITLSPFAKDRLALIVSPHHPWSGRGEFSVEELIRSPFAELILRETGSGTRKVFEDALGSVGLSLDDMKVLMELGSTQAIKALIKANVGVGVISLSTVKEELTEGSLKALHIEGLPLDRDFSFITREKELLSYPASRFIKACERFFDDDSTKIDTNDKT